MDKTYRVAVCDDEPVHLEKIKQEAQAILEENGWAYSIQAFSSEKELLEATRSTPDAFDLILLDVLLGGENGVDTAHALRQSGCASTIVFITVTADFAHKGYEVNAWRYLLKPVKREELARAISSDYHRSRANMYITFHKAGSVLRIRPQDIHYIETAGRGVVVHCTAEDIALPEKISEMEQLLPAATLVRCHKSYIVNVAHIEHIDRASITVSSQNSIPVGRKYYDAVRRALMAYLAR